MLLILFTKILIYFMRLLGGGSSKPGEIALKLNPNILIRLTEGYRIVLVAGTNGKTTTTSMLYNILKCDADITNRHIISNTSGANMTGGIVTCFAEHYKFSRDEAELPPIAVIEVDEAYFKHITAQISPEIIIVTNIFCDQLDRYGEIDNALDMIREAILNAPNAKIILNGDQPALSQLFDTTEIIQNGDQPNLPQPLDTTEIIYFGFEKGAVSQGLSGEIPQCPSCETPYSYNSETYCGLGDYYCKDCERKRPELKYKVNEQPELTSKGSTIIINDAEIHIGLPGLYNIYNALSAFAAGRELDVSDSVIATSLQAQTGSFGRCETITVDDIQLHMLLIKNPTGCNQCIDAISMHEGRMDLVFIINSNAGDGTDISWLYEADFERLRSSLHNRIIIAGSRRFDMAVRLKVAGFDTNKFIVCENYEGVLEAMYQPVVPDLNAVLADANTPAEVSPDVFVLPTYTAMTGFRKFLSDKGYADSSW